MSDDRWFVVKTVFTEALEREPGKRDTFLAERCSGDTALLDEVRSLLRAHEEAGRFIETPVGAAILPHASELASPGAMIGAYRIVREIGRGGMGTVYLAARADGAFQKEVALKIVRRGLDTEEILERFKHERQTLASLDHPNIARLLDGGTTSGGSPFFVMEHVDGTPIDRYCDERNLKIADRLALFHTLAMVVHAAHRNLVVHRDLKPDNVLVTADGDLKLLDFGIAKVLAPRSASALETSGARRLMTPDYASPEQILGWPITTATDVFSLGVLLYELLTGRRPFRRPVTGHGSIEREICERTPARPSAAVLLPLETVRPDGTQEAVAPEVVSSRRGSSPSALRRQLAGDLDAVVDMALRKEPELRYGSAEQLAEDVLRHAAGLPVVARKSAAYRAARFVRRNAAAVAAAAVLLAVLAAGVAGVAWQARVAAVERDRATLAADKARQISSFLEDMLRSPDPEKQGRNVTVVDTLDRAARRLDSETGLHPEVVAGVRRALGVTYGALGVYDAAEAQLRAAVALMSSDPAVARADLAETEIALAGILLSAGDLAGAEALYRHALETCDALGLKDDLRRGDALNGLGIILNKRGDEEGAESHYREALEIRRRGVGEDDVLVAESLNNLAVVMHARNDFAEAERLYKESLAIVRRARGDDHPGVPTALTNLGSVMSSLGRPEEGERLYREALSIRRSLLGDDHPDFAFTMYALADTLLELKRYGEAVEMSRDVLGRRSPSLPADHPVMAAAWLVLGKALLQQGAVRDAEAAIREGLNLRRTFLPEGHWLLASAEVALARCLSYQRRFEEAERLASGAYERLRSDRGPRHERTIEAAAILAELYERWQKPEKAAEFRDQR
jgi:eukaryotic-like serine/threonine-protein kinase